MFGAMKLRGLLAAILCVTLVAPVWAQGGRSAPVPARAEASCLYNEANGRWVPSGMPDIRRIAGTDRSPEIRFAGRVGGISVNVVDFRCDQIEYEITLLGSPSESFSSFASLLRRIERQTGIPNFSKLSPADLRTLERDEKFEWRNLDEYGAITITNTERSIVVRAYYHGYR